MKFPAPLLKVKLTDIVTWRCLRMFRWVYQNQPLDILHKTARGISSVLQAHLFILLWCSYASQKCLFDYCFILLGQLLKTLIRGRAKGQATPNVKNVFESHDWDFLSCFSGNWSSCCWSMKVSPPSFQEFPLTSPHLSQAHKSHTWQDRPPWYAGIVLQRLTGLLESSCLHHMHKTSASPPPPPY